MMTHLLGAALVASLLTSAAPTRSHTGAMDACSNAATDIASWPIVRSPRVPGLTLRLPRTFAREPDPAAAPSSASAGTSARWTHPARSQLVIARGAVPPAMMSGPIAGGAAYSRCEERVGSADAVIESYDRGRPNSVAAGESSFHVQARLRWPDGEELVVLGDAADRERFVELLAAVRTIRRTAA